MNQNLSSGTTSSSVISAKAPTPAQIARLNALARAVEHPSGYLPDSGLEAAVHVALTLRKPLLVTGEPGTGKTRLGWYVSWKLAQGAGEPDRPPLVFESKSSTTAKDLFYTYNTIGRFHAAQTNQGSQRSVDYITYNALGIAILNANERAKTENYLPDDFEHDGPRRSVVLIDEVDKAPRDFPNDILNEIENMYFKVPELGNARIGAPREMQPIVIITSNSEKNLPAPFLRRCIYYDIPIPSVDRLRQIVCMRLQELAATRGDFLEEALDLFILFRHDSSALEKKPATAELLDWLVFLVARGADTAQSLRNQGELVLHSLSAIIKSKQDQESAVELLNGWLHGAPLDE